MFSPSVLSAVELFATCAMGGVIWLVQLLVYPAFLRVPANSRTAYHRHHTERISLVVIPLMLAELASGAMMTRAQWPDLSAARWTAMACLALVWISTFAIQVPLHHRIARDVDERAIHRLIQTNWIRTFAWTAKALVLITAWPIER